MTTEVRNFSDIMEWRWASDHPFIKVKKFTSAYLIEDILIDTTAPAGVDDFISYFNPKLMDGSISKCIITHWHEDHSGAINILRNKYNLPVYAPSYSMAKLNEELHLPKYRSIYWGDIRESCIAKPLTGPINSKSGNYNFEIIPVPGHSEDQIALVDYKNEIIFTADAIMPKYQMIFGGSSDIQEDIHQIYDSIAHLYRIADTMQQPRIFVSHFDIVPKKFLKEKLDEIIALRDKAHEINNKLMDEGIVSKKKFMRLFLKRMFKGEHTLASFTQGELSRENLIRSLLEWKIS